MKIETLKLGNQIHILQDKIRQRKEKIKLIESNAVENLPPELHFLRASIYEEKKKVNELIQSQLNETLTNLNHLFSGLCDETYHIILASFNSYAQIPTKKQQVKIAYDEEDDEDEEPTPVKIAKKSKPIPKCPHGHTFGKDIDGYEVCDTCTLYDKCEESMEDNF